MRPDQLASEALRILNTAKITALMVVDDGRPVGALHIHDLLHVGVHRGRTAATYLSTADHL